MASPYLDCEYRCSRCGTRFWDGDAPDGECLSCVTRMLVEDRVGWIDFTADDGNTVRVLVRESEAPEFFERLDRTLRACFGIRLAAVGGCDREVERRIGVVGRLEAEA
ncbi:MAG: hypothetical protein IT379_14755 [Deltaproteobacteria bacterium]|nr:hypothetical protein [Deltaproteobacteria bacterium]